MMSLPWQLRTDLTLFLVFGLFQTWKRQKVVLCFRPNVCVLISVCLSHITRLWMVNNARLIFTTSTALVGIQAGHEGNLCHVTRSFLEPSCWAFAYFHSESDTSFCFGIVQTWTQRTTLCLTLYSTRSFPSSGCSGHHQCVDSVFIHDILLAHVYVALSWDNIISWQIISRWHSPCCIVAAAQRWLGADGLEQTQRFHCPFLRLHVKRVCLKLRSEVSQVRSAGQCLVPPPFVSFRGLWC